MHILAYDAGIPIILQAAVGTIAGINMYAMLGICMGVLLVFGLVFVQMQIGKNRKAVEKHVYCEFINKGGNSYAILLPEANGIIEAPPEHKVAGGRYYVHPKKIYNSVYPPGAWKAVQAPCKKAYFAEGNPDPIDPFEKEPLVTALLLHNAINEKFSQLMLESANELYDKLEDIMKMIKINPTIIYIGLGVCVLGIAVVGYLVYQQGALIRGIPGIVIPK